MWSGQESCNIQATVTCFVFFSSAVQGVILMVIENWLGGPLPTKYEEIETCSLKHGYDVVADLEGTHLEPRDYTYYLLFVTVYMLVLISIYMFFFKTELRRTNAGLVTRPPRNVSFNMDKEKDVESLLTGGMAMVRAVTPRQRQLTCSF